MLSNKQSYEGRKRERRGSQDLTKEWKNRGKEEFTADKIISTQQVLQNRAMRETNVLRQSLHSTEDSVTFFVRFKFLLLFSLPPSIKFLLQAESGLS